MKKCTYCGLENPDEAIMCSTCHTEFVTASPPSPGPPVALDYEMSWEEKRFWERMTFRQFAVVIVRLQALWLFFYAVLDITYLPRFAIGMYRASSYFALTPEYRLEMVLAVLRILMNVAAGLALIMYTERILSWLVKDSVTKSPQTAAPSDSTRS